MKVSLTDAGKRFNRDWIFRHFMYTFEAGTSYAITGPNGSGKSTMLQAIAGALHLNEGHLDYIIGPGVSFRSVYKEDPVKQVSNRIPDEAVYSQVSFCAPYLELIEEMTLLEFLDFHHQFKPFLEGINSNNIVQLLGLEKSANKQIRYFSSGMKQRVKLAQCILSDTPVLLLDEPCTNLDTDGIDLYHRLVNRYSPNRIVIVSSNDEVEYRFCKEKININDYK